MPSGTHRTAPPARVARCRQNDSKYDARNALWRFAAARQDPADRAEETASDSRPMREYGGRPPTRSSGALSPRGSGSQYVAAQAAMYISSRRRFALSARRARGHASASGKSQRTSPIAPTTRPGYLRFPSFGRLAAFCGHVTTGRITSCRDPCREDHGGTRPRSPSPRRTRSSCALAPDRSVNFS
jgi:hypothetical protein